MDSQPFTGPYHRLGPVEDAERRLFDKGIIIDNKDFFRVQKLIQTKTVVQCTVHSTTTTRNS